ncbi:hypothetical protein [Bacillus velezensis]|uniref:hypothetical protein n=1 Tax=Bacillus velezensis TaxID=492670 RepID=UPI0010D70051|nr:hypothetical protein [Bacillus velezensis]
MEFEIQFKETAIRKVVIDADNLEEAKKLFEDGDYANHKVVEIECIEKELVEAYPLED